MFFFPKVKYLVSKLLANFLTAPPYKIFTQVLRYSYTLTELLFEKNRRKNFCILGSQTTYVQYIVQWLASRRDFRILQLQQSPEIQGNQHIELGNILTVHLRNNGSGKLKYGTVRQLKFICRMYRLPKMSSLSCLKCGIFPLNSCKNDRLDA